MKSNIVTKDAIIEKLEKFKFADKFATFYRIRPNVLLAEDDQQDAVSVILDDCCRELIKLYRAAKKKPTKTSLKKVCMQCMNTLYKATVREENKDFAYELCWYVCEIVGVDFKKMTSSKKWGYKKV